ncbi:CobW family GTP-binding protein [Gallaecimonas xiamenensis]|uniref:Putative cobalamin synthesis protein n=1 Tax=Gallaecimonas xiamenensis 3-C-1 TaxID=745411 RepID=K2J493_9GAMM|nr:GTP-binding protein [Gallaecimonas xiamenensis]EKE77861.1 putative cobalamin synthesis protein [Gallaecimonas xiamenensis 3-C-1]
MTFSAPIRTHVLTGFLGTGKTTAIRHLLAHKPQGQKWAVLVNEFGEVGIDGALLSDTGAAIREVPGGCICCAQGLPMQVALNQLIREQRPDLLLIEPTGLGHPASLVQQLSASQYQGVLALGATLTLVNPQALFDNRYLTNDTFCQQLALADLLVFNKTDLAACPDKAEAFAKADSLGLTPNRLWLSQGQVPPAALDTAARPVAQKLAQTPAQAVDSVLPASLSVPEGELFISRSQQQDGVHSLGLLFAPGCVFDFRELWFLFSAFDVLRLKAVMMTEKGMMAFNAVDGALAITELGVDGDSKVELIDLEALDAEALEQGLRAALLPA